MVKAGRVSPNPRDEFKMGEYYDRLDMVTYNDGLYLAKKDNVSVLPTDKDSWMFLMDNGIGGSGKPGRVLPDGITVTIDADGTIHANIDTQKVNFTEATTRSNINSGETLPTLMGKIKKVISDLKIVAFSNNYNDLDNKPQALKNPSSLTFTGGSTEVYDGSSAKSVKIPNTPTDVGADPAGSANTALTQAKSYTDTSVSDAKTELKGYTDTSASNTKSELKEYTNTEIAAAKSYTDTSLATGKKYTDDALATGKKYTDTRVAELIDGAPETLDTFKEIAEEFKKNQAVVDALNEAIGKKANAEDFNSHTGDTTSHITSTERTNWNDANSKKHTHENKSVLDGITSALINTWNTVGNKVDKVTGKQLSTEDYTSAEKTKLAGIATGATANSASSTTPKVAGTASTGSETGYSRGDHVHPAQTSVSGNAGSATKLANARKIGNASFDGTDDITLSQIGAAAEGHTHAAQTSVSGNAGTATKLATGRTFSVTGDATGTSSTWDGSGNCSIPLTLVNSGCTAGSYGPANATNSPGNGGSFNVPYITVDAKGRVTSISNRTVNMPAAYSHPSTAGNKHIPSGGSTGKILGYGGSSGTAEWVDGKAFTTITNKNLSTIINDGIYVLYDCYDDIDDSHGHRLSYYNYKSESRIYNGILYIYGDKDKYYKNPDIHKILKIVTMNGSYTLRAKIVNGKLISKGRWMNSTDDIYFENVSVYDRSYNDYRNPCKPFNLNCIQYNYGLMIQSFTVNIGSPKGNNGFVTLPYSFFDNKYQCYLFDTNYYWNPTNGGKRSARIPLLKAKESYRISIGTDSNNSFESSEGYDEVSYDIDVLCIGRWRK